MDVSHPDPQDRSAERERPPESVLQTGVHDILQKHLFFQNSAFYNPAVDEKYLILSVCAGKRRFGDVSGDSRFFSAVVYGNKIFIFFQLVNRENGGQQISVSRRRKEDIAVIDQTELYLGIGQSDLRDKIDDSAAFRRIGFKKLSSGRRIVERDL